jgi:hypothetical protein
MRATCAPNVEVYECDSSITSVVRREMKETQPRCLREDDDDEEEEEEEEEEDGD